jgi:hypothetical protein
VSKIIFLDFDGVLNNKGSFLWEARRRERHPDNFKKKPLNQTLCPINTSNFQFILDQTVDLDVKIVISSNWRILFKLTWLKKKLKSYGIDSKKVIGKTPDLRIRPRGMEISQWLDAQKEAISDYIILDDDDDGLSDYHADHFIKTDWNAGLTFERALKAIRRLEDGPPKKTPESLDNNF